MRITSRFLGVVVLAGLGLAASSASASFMEGFNGTAFSAGWVTTNLSTRNSTGNPWSIGAAIVDADSNPVVLPHEGDGFAVVNYTSVGSGAGTINNWLISPMLTGIQNGDTFDFFTTTTPDSAFPDRLEVRLSTNGASTNVGATATSVGDFTTLMLSVNPTLAVGGYPEDWTEFTATVSGLGAPVNGRMAFRYFVTAGGPTGANSNIIGVDALTYTNAPEPASAGLVLCGLTALAKRRRR